MAKKKKRKKSTKITVSRAALVKVIHAGASHHAALAQLKKTVRVGIVKRKKAAKKRTKKRAKRR